LYNKKKNKIKTLLLIDIFHMKNINASYGFKNGNAVIKQFNKLIKTVIKREINNMLINNFAIKANCKVTRHYSDVIAITIYADLNQTAIIKIKDIIIQNLLVHQFKLTDPKLHIYINTTIGCSKSADENLIVYAEKALHNAKKNLDAFLFFDANLYKNESSNNDLVELIKYNIQNKKVAPYFQAIYCNKTNSIVKYEALMRLFDRQGNVLLPNTFLEKAKSYRLYVQLMQILIGKVFDSILKYKMNISINLDYNDIINPLIRDIITTQIHQQDIGQYLTIEILESERIQDFDIINDFIREVKNYDVSIAIDDFGTGFSNYEYILKLNVDYLKIDGSLIQKINEDIYRNLVTSIINFCKKEHIETVAEFVSDLKIQRRVKSLDIDYSQGFYIQKPMSINKLLGVHSEG